MKFERKNDNIKKKDRRDGVGAHGTAVGMYVDIRPPRHGTTIPCPSLLDLNLSLSISSPSLNAQRSRYRTPTSSQISIFSFSPFLSNEFRSLSVYCRAATVVDLDFCSGFSTQRLDRKKGAPPPSSRWRRRTPS